MSDPKSQVDTSVRTFPVLALKNSLLFPYQAMPLAVGRPRSMAAIDAALATEDKSLIVASQRDPIVEEPAFADLFEIATTAIVKRVDRLENGLQAIVVGTARVKLAQGDDSGPFMKSSMILLPEPADSGAEVEGLHRAVVDVAAKILQLIEVPVEIHQLLRSSADPLQHCYLLATVLSMDLAKEQALMAANSRADALKLMHEYLTYEMQVQELRHKITHQAESELSKQQREYVLRQQMQAIQQELGEGNPEEAELAELRKRLEEANLPDNVRAELEKELRYLQRLPPAAADYQVTRTHVELALELPWSKMTEDNLDLNRARQVLDEDHFGLKDVKQRIVEHLAVMKLNPEAKSPILCFVGPPGVGKTSLGQSIARALGRKFERQSLGGLHDEAELRGHRRTYIGAMPGRIIQALRRAGVKNPLLMLDEIDKLGRDFRGDPASALMEVLDPAQNAEFHDNYLDLPFDLSHVFFVTTANSLDPIPRPLLDRMEILRLTGYSDQEKLEIAKRYLIPRQLAQAGLKPEQLSITDNALRKVIRRYTREAGVRELERLLGRIARKVATRIADGRTEPVIADEEQLNELLGTERFFSEASRKNMPPGVVTGLAWTEAGGDVLYVEAALLPGGSDMTLTGQLGDVMKESARAAITYIRSHHEELGIKPSSFQKNGVHIHVPAGAIPKDGPSAGVTMVTAIASLFLRKATRPDTAMTGEITLAGLVLPVGGIREKVLAAHRTGIRRVILPRDNEQDLAEFPAEVKRDMEFVMAERIEDVLAAALPNMTQLNLPQPAVA
jgi:ATP-dependent Lon protease